MTPSLPPFPRRRSLLLLAPALWLSACGGGGSGDDGATVPAPSPTVSTETPPPAAAQAAMLLSPSGDSKLDGASVRFAWDAADGDAYGLRIESAASATTLYDSVMTGQSVTVPDLPTEGEVLTVTLRTRKDGVWLAPATYRFIAAGYTPLQSSDAQQPWTAPIPLPLIPVSAANLPDGKLLLWSAAGPVGYSINTELATYTTVFDPATSSTTPAVTVNPGQEMFCEGLSMLADGGILVSGGSDAGKTSRYDPETGSWSAAGTLNIARGYNASATLSDGNVFTVGGSWNGAAPGGKYGELWSASTQTWRTLSGVPADMPPQANIIVGADQNPTFNASVNDPLAGPDVGSYYRADNHMWLFGVADGWVFHAGPSAAMHWIDTRGNGKIIPAGLRGDDTYAMTGGAVMYDAYKILKLAGSPAHDWGFPLKTAYSIDISGAAPTPPTVRKLAPLAYARAFSSSVVLPSGEVVVIGGMTLHGPGPDDYSVLTPEIWNPATETFTALQPMQVPRNYHSIVLLLMDGRVLAAGGGLCGVGCAANHLDAEILTPPYLLTPEGTPAPRPAISQAPERAAPGDAIAVQTDRAVARFALVRMASVTHTVNTDQRRIPLTATGSDGDYRLTIPSDRGLVIPGNYMLFALDARGVPSVARTINVR